MSYEIVKDIPDSLSERDEILLECTGCDILDLAARTTNFSLEIVRDSIKNHVAGVVPISTGEGLIRGFSEAVAAVLSHLGMKSWVTNDPDVTGLGEAIKKGADSIFAADDQTFLAINLKTRKTVDNSWATANGFVQALSASVEKMEHNLSGQNVLVLGLGSVGRYAVEALLRLQVKVLAYDNDAVKLKRYTEAHKEIHVVADLRAAFDTIDYILDATPAAGIIDETMIRPTTIVSSPGVPHSLTTQALNKIGKRFIHDPLVLGVAVMALNCLFP